MKDKVVFITGATGGLGSVVARSLAEQGARLALFGTNPDRLTNLADALALPDDRVLTGVFDFTQPEAAQRALDAALGKLGRVDVLLHLVGGWIGGKAVTDVPAEEMSNMLDQHLWTTFYLAKAVVPRMVESGWGRLIVVSSPVASRPAAKMGPYAVGKAAQEALMLTVAREVARSGVTANILHVRSIDTAHERDREPSPKNANWTTPEEITSAILYLCSDEARVVNGARISLHGVD